LRLALVALMLEAGAGWGAGAPDPFAPKGDGGMPGMSASEIARLKFGTPGLIKNQDGVIFGTQEAFDLVVEAKKYDPSYAQESQRDRDKAAAIYAKAMAAQPGAKSNAVLANRIAQMNAFNADPARGVMPNPEEAVRWWNRCLELTDETQILWAQAHVGLGTAEDMNQILAMKAERLELPPWIDWAYPGAGKPEEERARMLKDFQEIQDLARRRLKEWEARAATEAMVREAIQERVRREQPSAPKAEPVVPEPEEAALPSVAESAPGALPVTIAEGHTEGQYQEMILVGAAAGAAVLVGLGVVLSKRRGN
jgi:hypothetical protein